MTQTAPRPKGSQLSQLRRAVRDAGLASTPAHSHSISPGSRDKRRSAASSPLKHWDLRQKKLRDIHASQNLFDIKSSKIKFPTTAQVHHAARATSGSSKAPRKTSGRPAQSASRAHQRRVETLLPEYQSRHRSSRFLDRRFGHDDSTLTPEEKALERFTREKQERFARAKKHHVFNLEDGAEGLDPDEELGEAVELTHAGRSLDLDGSVLDIATAPGPLSSFPPPKGGSAPGEDGASLQKKSKAEVMSELITKSKAHKYQNQMLKDKDDQLRENLDQELKDIRSLLHNVHPLPTLTSDQNQSPLPSPTSDDSQLKPASPRGKRPDANDPCSKQPPGSLAQSTQASCLGQAPASPSTSAPPGVDRSVLASLIGCSSRNPSVEPEPAKDDDYDRYVRELAFEARAKPSDRLKTVEEKALEEAQRLKTLEERRLKRMRFPEEEDEHGEEPSRALRTKKRRPEADDLGDSFGLGQPNLQEFSIGSGLQPGGALGPSVVRSDEQASAPSQDTSSSSQFSNQPCEPGTEQCSSNQSSGKDEEQRLSLGLPAPTLLASRGSKPKVAPIQNELAYTYPCPASHKELLSLLSATGAKPSDLITIIQRIRILHHPSLGRDNKEKLATLTNVLIDHLAGISQTSSSPNSLRISFSGLLPHIVSLCQTYTQTAASHFVSKLDLMHRNLSIALLHQAHSAWPQAAQLLLFRVIGVVWSTSDFSHPVAAPALLLMSQYLSQLKVSNFKEFVTGLYLCTLVLMYESHSKRLVPEVINFLSLAVLRLSSSKHDMRNIPSVLPLPEGCAFVTFMPVQSVSHLQPRRFDLEGLLTQATPVSASDYLPSDQEIVDIFDVVLSLWDNYSHLYHSAAFYPEIFSPVLQVLQMASSCPTSEAILARLTHTLASIRSSVDSSWRQRQLNPLRLQNHRPVLIKPQTPRFDANFTPGRHKFDPDQSNVEMSKLKKLIKKEKKGAIKELRKDNRFLAAEKAKEKDKADTEYKTKISRITAGLQLERSDEKKLERTKVRLKKLDKARSNRKHK